LELELIGWVLPETSPGYAKCLEFIKGSSVLGRGRRGEGEVIIGRAGDQPDLGAPLPPVYAYGVIETADDTISVTVREIIEGQLSVEIVGRLSDKVTGGFTVRRRWTFSTWRPADQCPQCATAPRVVPIRAPERSSVQHAIAFCTTDRRFWVFDGLELTCRPIPVTTFYNELMLVKNIRDPRIALDGRNIWRDLANYSDRDLALAFAAYNRMKGKVEIARDDQAPAGGRRSLLSRIGSLFGK
jgi:hypothetical protein